MPLKCYENKINGRCHLGEKKKDAILALQKLKVHRVETK